MAVWMYCLSMGASRSPPHRPGAWIYLDNVNQSVVTPATLPDIIPESHTINVTLDGYQVATQRR